jgi:hypothetical protein
MKEAKLEEIRDSYSHLFKNKHHASDSGIRVIAEIAAKMHFRTLYPKMTLLRNKDVACKYGKYNVDLCSECGKLYVEVYSGLNVLKPGQNAKIARDVLKLSMIMDSEADKFIAVIDPKIKAILEGNTWLHSAMDKYKVKVELIPIDNELRDFIKVDIEDNRQGNKI